MAQASYWPDDGLKYYAYILLYVDDCLCIHHDAESALKGLDKYFQIKAGSIGDPDIYLRYKLRIMGVPLAGPSLIHGDNMSVIHNTQKPESVLRKKSNQLCYHAVREAVAMGECLTGSMIESTKNPADLATKLIPGGWKRNYLIGKLLFDICDY